MTAYAYDHNGFFLGSFEPQVDPLESEAQGETVFLIPPGATLVEPTVTTEEGKILQWDGDKWNWVLPPEPEPVIEETHTPLEPTPEELAEEEVQKLRGQVMSEARDRLLAARAAGITSANAPAVLTDLLIVMFGEA